MLRELTHFLAPFMWAAAGMVWLWLSHKQKMARIAAQGGHDPLADATARSQERELAELRERVRVLERIATDGERNRGPHALAAQIDALRD